MYRSPCLVQIEPGLWLCELKGIRLRTTAERIVCICDSSPGHPNRAFVARTVAKNCPYDPVIRQAAELDAGPAATVARLERCRSADCGLLHRKDGVAVCVGRGSSCQWIRNWAEFLASDEDCAHWPS